MATRALYDKARQSLAEKEVDWTTDVIKAILVRIVAGPAAGGNSVYALDIANHQFLSSIPNNAYCRPVTAVTVTSPLDPAGILDCDDLVFPSVASGDAIGAVIFYIDGASDAVRRLLIYEDVATGFPVTPNGTNITVQIDNGANKLCKI